MANRSIVHVEFPAADPRAAARFYADAFGWEITHDDTMNYSMFRSGNDKLGGGFPQTGEMYEPGNVLVYVESEDIEEDLARIQRLGGRTVVPKTEIPETGYFAVFTDPTGNRVGLFTSSQR